MPLVPAEKGKRCQFRHYNEATDEWEDCPKMAKHRLVKDLVGDGRKYDIQCCAEHTMFLTRPAPRTDKVWG